METKGKLSTWMEKETKYRKYFLIIYISFIQLSGYHYISEACTNSISECSPFNPLFIGVVMHNAALLISSFLLWKNRLSIVCGTWILIIVNTSLGTPMLCQPGAPTVYFLVGINHHIIFPITLSMCFGTRVIHIITHQVVSIGLILFYLLYMIGGLFQANPIWEISTLEYIIFKDTLYAQLTLLLLPRFLQIYLSYKREELLKELNREKERESESKERFFACMSHEMRNPLHALIGTIDLISNAESKEEIDPKIVRSGKFSGELLLSLIGNILDFSKLKANKMETFIDSIDLREKLSNILAMFETRAKNSNLYLKSIVDPLLPPALECDGRKLDQVLINILGNALKFTHKGGIIVNIEWIDLSQIILTQSTIQDKLNEVFLSSSREQLSDPIDEDFNTLPFNINPLDMKNRSGLVGKARKSLDFSRSLSFDNLTEFSIEQDYIEQKNEEIQKKSNIIQKKVFGICKIEIIDTGIGLSTSQSQRLFQPFVQAEASISQKYGGTGLGLWISRSQIRLLGGDIRIESEEEKGSNFMIGLPMESSEELPAINGNEDRLWKRSKRLYSKKQCIYIDDQACNQELLTPLLKYLGFKSVSISNGLKALNYLEALDFHIDLIITDLRMPIMSGQTFISEIRKLEKGKKRPKIPIIVLTGEPSENERSFCRSLHVDEYLDKPASFNRITEAIHHALEPRQPTNLNISPTKHKEAVLIIDDDQFCSFLTKQFLGSLDLVVYQAYSLQTGLKKYEESAKEISFVIMDNWLPDGRGVDGVEQIRKYEESENLERVRIVSASGEKVESQRKMYSKRHQISDYLQKPFTKESLIKVLMRSRRFPKLQ